MDVMDTKGVFMTDSVNGKYEMVVLYHPDLEIDLDKALSKVTSILSNVGAKVLYSDNWGKRRLAYPIAKQDYAVYVYYEIEAEKNSLSKLEGLLNIADEVIRYLITKPTETFGDREKSHISNEEPNGEASDKTEAKTSTKSKAKTKKEE